MTSVTQFSVGRFALSPIIACFRSSSFPSHGERSVELIEPVGDVDQAARGEVPPVGSAPLHDVALAGREHQHFEIGAIEAPDDWV